MGRRRVELDSVLGITKLELSGKGVPGLPVEELVRARDGFAERKDDVVAYAVNLRAGRSFGTEEVILMASHAEDARDWWLAARYWSVARQLVFEVSNNGPAQEPASKSLHAISQMSQAPDPEARDELRLRNAQVIITAFDIPNVLSWLSELDEILRSPAAAKEPATAVACRMFFTIAMPKNSDWTGSIEDTMKLVESYWALEEMLQTAANTDPDPHQRAMCEIMLVGMPQFCDLLVMHAAFDWETVYGVDGAGVIAGLRAYNYHAHHKFLVTATNGDGALCNVSILPFLLRWGNIAVVEELADKLLPMFRLSMAETGSYPCHHNRIPPHIV